MAQYKIECRIGDRLSTRTIECREMTIKDGAYCFGPENMEKQTN